MSKIPEKEKVVGKTMKTLCIMMIKLLSVSLLQCSHSDKEAVASSIDTIHNCLANLETYSLIDKVDSLFINNYIKEYNKTHYLNLIDSIDLNEDFIDISQYFNYDSIIKQYKPFQYINCVEKVKRDTLASNDIIIISNLINLPYLVKAGRVNFSFKEYIRGLDDQYFLKKSYRHFLTFSIFYYYIENSYSHELERLPDLPNK